MNRSLSIRSHRGTGGTGGSSTLGSGSTTGSSGRRGFSLASLSLRNHHQPELSRRLARLIKSENSLIGAHEAAGKERVSIATQLSEWGEQTGDDSISDVSDKVGVILSELGEQEDNYAHALDESRGVLKAIRNTEKSVQPSRDGKAKIADEIARLKAKEPETAKLVVLEQELVRAEAENLVAEAQLTNITRQKLKEAYQAEFLATIERAEKQTILARHGLRLLQLLDDTPVVPGDARVPFADAAQARQILNDAEDDLRDWRLESSLASFPRDQQDEISGANRNHQAAESTAPSSPAQTVVETRTRSSTLERNGAGGGGGTAAANNAKGAAIQGTAPTPAEVGA